MDKPLQHWYCDVCDGKIEDVESGYVIWRSTGLGYRGFKIVHQSKCDSDSYPASAALKNFIGSSGLNYLMSFLSPGPLMTRNRGGTPSVTDFDEFSDFVRRVQIPYYEEARRFFGIEEVINHFCDANEVYPYTPDVLKSIIEQYGR